jgi:hypothetical protein
MTLLVLNGGLGNQLFQYALGRRIAHDRQEPLLLDISEFAHAVAGKTPRTYRLHHFNIQASLATPEQIQRFTDPRLIARIQRRILRQVAPQWAFYSVYERETFVYDDSVLAKKGNIRLLGYWQHPHYFAPITNTLLQELQVITSPSVQNSTLLENIKQVNAVALHIRRGDYVTNAHTNQFHGVAPLSYYHQAVTQLAQEVSNVHIFVFSDDTAWARENLHLAHPMTFVDHNTPETDYEDLRLMAHCQHHIIANSSFSWWGAWLAQNPQQRVFAPYQWTRNHTAHDIAPSHWTII